MTGVDRGYVVSEGNSNDGFALLKAPYVFNVKKSRKNNTNNGEEGGDSESNTNTDNGGKRSGKRKDKSKKKRMD